MTNAQSAPKQIAKTLLYTVLVAVCSSQAAQANDKLTLENFKSLKFITFNKTLKVRGIEMTKGVYLGQAKVAGKYGFGVVVDNKNFSWGINNRGVSILKTF
jgi:hypothetical protein